MTSGVSMDDHHLRQGELGGAEERREWESVIRVGHVTWQSPDLGGDDILVSDVPAQFNDRLHVSHSTLNLLVNQVSPARQVTETTLTCIISIFWHSLSNKNEDCYCATPFLYFSPTSTLAS